MRKVYPDDMIDYYSHKPETNYVPPTKEEMVLIIKKDKTDRIKRIILRSLLFLFCILVIVVNLTNMLNLTNAAQNMIGFASGFCAFLSGLFLYEEIFN